MTKVSDLKDKSVYVENEFAPLRRAILSQSEFVFPKDESIPKRDALLLLMGKERERLKTILEGHGIEVLMPRKLTDSEKTDAVSEDGITDGTGMSNYFSRDPIIVIGNRIIELNLRSKRRRYEVLAMRDIIEKEKEDCKYISMPHLEDCFLEGGDILVLGNTVFVGLSEYTSNEKGYQWLKDNLTEYGYDVKPVRLKDCILHLDCVIGLVKDGLMIVCEDFLEDGIPDELSSWDRINVSTRDTNRMAVNGLPISEDTYLTDSAFRDTIGIELEKRGINVEYLDCRFTRAFKGSFHCSVNPLLRMK